MRVKETRRRKGNMLLWYSVFKMSDFWDFCKQIRWSYSWRIPKQTFWIRHKKLLKQVWYQSFLTPNWAIGDVARTKHDLVANPLPVKSGKRHPVFNEKNLTGWIIVPFRLDKLSSKWIRLKIEATPFTSLNPPFAFAHTVALLIPPQKTPEVEPFEKFEFRLKKSGAEVSYLKQF